MKPATDQQNKVYFGCRTCRHFEFAARKRYGKCKAPFPQWMHEEKRVNGISLETPIIYPYTYALGECAAYVGCPEKIAIAVRMVQQEVNHLSRMANRTED